MALLITADIVQAVATLLDDPGQTNVDADYILPFMNLRKNNLIVNLAMLGLQYGEATAIFTLPAGTSDLSSFMISGQPLQSLMEPKTVEWKQVGEPDDQYEPVDCVNELDDEPQGGNAGIDEYAWQGGTLTVTPSTVDVVLRVKYYSFSIDLADPDDQTIRGVGDVLAYRAAELIWPIRGNAALGVKMQQEGDQALDDFLAMSTMKMQSQVYRLPATHQRGRSLAGYPNASR